MTTTPRTLALLLCAACVAGCSPAADVTGRPIVIGAVAPLTGAGVNVGKPYVQGLETAAAEINAEGGINGRTLEIAVQDGRLDSVESSNGTQALIALKDPSALVGVFGITALAVGPVAEAAGKPFLYEAYIRSPLTGRHTFKAGYTVKEGCAELVTYAKKTGAYQKLGILMAQMEYNDLCLEGIRDVEPDVAVYAYEFGEKDFRSHLYRAHEDGVDALTMIGIDYEYVTLFDQLGQSGYGMRVLCATASECIFPEVEEAAPAAALEGTLASDYVTPAFRDSPFARAFRAAHPDATPVGTMYAAAAYDSMQYLASALRACDPDDGECVSKALENVHDIPTTLGSDGFRGRELQLPRYLLEYRGGAWRPVADAR